MNSDSLLSTSSLTTEEIAPRAYAIWEACGRPVGQEHEHWLRAERELLKDRRQAEECRSSFGDNRKNC